MITPLPTPSMETVPNMKKFMSVMIAGITCAWFIGVTFCVIIFPASTLCFWSNAVVTVCLAVFIQELAFNQKWNQLMETYHQHAYGIYGKVVSTRESQGDRARYYFVTFDYCPRPNDNGESMQHQQNRATTPNQERMMCHEQIQEDHPVVYTDSMPINQQDGGATQQQGMVWRKEIRICCPVFNKDDPIVIYVLPNLPKSGMPKFAIDSHVALQTCCWSCYSSICCRYIRLISKFSAAPFLYWVAFGMSSPDDPIDGGEPEELLYNTALVRAKWAFVISLVLLPFPMYKVVEFWNWNQVYGVLEGGEEIESVATDSYGSVSTTAQLSSAV